MWEVKFGGWRMDCSRSVTVLSMSTLNTTFQGNFAELFDFPTAEFHWVGTLMASALQSGMDSSHQRNKNITFLIVFALPERRLMTARNKDTGDKKMDRLERAMGWVWEWACPGPGAQTEVSLVSTDRARSQHLASRRGAFREITCQTFWMSNHFEGSWA